MAGNTICQLLHSLQVGGAEVLAARLARQLCGSFQFLFICLDELGGLGEELRAEGFPVEVLGRRPGVDWRCPLRLLRLWRRYGVSLVHAHNYSPFFYGLSARVLYRRPAVLFSEHGRPYPDYPRRKHLLANRLLLEPRDRVVGVGGAVRQALKANEGIAAERIRVIYNGIDLTAFANDIADREDTRRALGVSPGDLVVMQVARLVPVKDHGTALRALEQVVRQRPASRLVLVGEGPERGVIQGLIRQKGLGAHVRLLGLRDDVPRLLRAADLFLLSSLTEGVPLGVIEAMAAGLPVVATRVGGLDEIVEEGATGCLVPAGDATSLAQSILRLASQPSLRVQMGQTGRQRAQTLFSESRMHAQYVGLYREMLHA